jgi:hypothetical protein
MLSFIRIAASNKTAHRRRPASCRYLCGNVSETADPR